MAQQQASGALAPPNPLSGGSVAELPGRGHSAGRSILGRNAQRRAAELPGRRSLAGVFPGLSIAITVFAVNLLGDALHDVPDPRMRGAH